MAKRKNAPAAAAPSNPFGCQTKGCAGILVPRNARGHAIDLEREGAAKWVCSRGGGPGCGFAADADNDDGFRTRCPADGAPLTFDPTIVGKTCGGLQLRGWDRCAHCGGVWVSRRGIPDTAGGSDGRWQLAAGGRSLDAGSLRLRVDGRASAGESGDNVKQLMARISRMPAFETALEKIASGKLDAESMRALAAEALSIGDGVEETESAS